MRAPKQRQPRESEMIAWRQSIYVKLSAALWVLVFSVCGLQFFVLYSLWTRAETERIQLLNWELAVNYARDLRPILEHDGISPELRRALGRLSGFNFEAEVFILDQHGKPLAWSYRGPNSEADVVPIELLERFLTSEPNRRLPLLGPKLSKPGRNGPFVAERILIRDRPGYLYVVLDGLRAGIYRGTLLDRYLLFGGGFTSGLLSLFAFIVGAVVFSILTRRLRVLTQTVDRIADGDYRARIELTGKDEVHHLAAQINAMAATIDANIETIRAGDESRRQLIATLSHDLRTPITALRANLEATEASLERLSAEERRERFRRMFGTIENLTELLSQLFELAKLESGERKPAREPFSLSELISEEVFFEQEIFARERGVALVLVAPEGLPFVSADAEMIYRVLLNLVKNAITHTPQEGTVTVTLTTRASRIEVSVSDTGCGIAEGDLRRVFDRFYTGDTARTRGRGGTGLGLAIVKQMLNLHEEEIFVESTVGVGTRFWFTLPRAQI